MGEAGVKIAAALAGVAAAAAAACAPLFQSETPAPIEEPAAIQSQLDEAVVLPTSAPSGDDACDAQAHGHLMGMTYEQARASDSLPRRVRFICHGCMVTQDFVADRLNLYLDAEGRVERLTCG